MPLGATVARAEVILKLETRRPRFDLRGQSQCAWLRPGHHRTAGAGTDRNAAKVGAHMKARLDETAEAFPIVGDVRGLGLMIGIELVRDQATKGARAGTARPARRNVFRARSAWCWARARTPCASVLRW